MAAKCSSVQASTKERALHMSGLPSLPALRLLLGQAPGVGQHQLDAVLLVDLGGPGIVVDGHDIEKG